jgi:hypothetical protein
MLQLEVGNVKSRPLDLIACQLMRFHAKNCGKLRKMPVMDRMHTGARRALTEGEVALGLVVFADEIAWERVRVLQAPRFGFGAMAPFGGLIIFSNWRAAQDFAEAPVGEQGWFVHELAHVWQSTRGMFLPALKLGALGKGAYAYKARKSAAFKEYNIERQAEIARHLWLARTGVREAGMPEHAWLEDVWASRFTGRSPAA